MTASDALRPVLSGVVVDPSTGVIDRTQLDEYLAAIDRAAEEHRRRTVPDNTRRAYESDWRVWEAFTAVHGLPPTAVSAGLLVAFVEHLAQQGKAPSTIDRRLSGATVVLREQGVHIDGRWTEQARDALKAVKRRLAEANEKRGRGKARAVTVQDLRRICAALPDDLAGRRDRALILLALTIAGRRSEVASLLVSDIEEQPEGLTVTVRVGKTAESARTVAVPWGSHAGTCPVRAWRAWLEASGITEGPAFRRINRHGRMLDAGLSGEAVGDIIARRGRAVGLTLTGHSLRAGLATEARRAGHDRKTIAQQGGWVPTSAVLDEYTQIVDRWSDNAVAGIGL